MFTMNSSSDDSDASDSTESDSVEVEGKSSFRVSVCLRRHFSDVRARAWVLVRARRRVRWLHRRLARLFGVRGVCLRVRGRLLPRAEPLRLLRRGDTVEVIPLQEAQAENQSRRDATTQTAAEAAAAQLEEKTITSTPYSAGVAACSGTSPHRDNRDSGVNSNNHYEDRCSERLMDDSTESVTELPTTAAAHTTVDTVDWAPGDALQGAADVHSSEEGSLLSLKRRALALLDERCAAAGEGPPPRRRRRRVRRRAERAAAAPSPPPPHAAAAPPPGDVARNEDACARRPRMVHSLDLDMTCDKTTSVD